MNVPTKEAQMTGLLGVECEPLTSGKSPYQLTLHSAVYSGQQCLVMTIPLYLETENGDSGGYVAISTYLRADATRSFIALLVNAIDLADDPEGLGGPVDDTCPFCGGDWSESCPSASWDPARGYRTAISMRCRPCDLVLSIDRADSARHFCLGDRSPYLHQLSRFTP